jgi:gliding motility-associated-like protein
MKKAALLFLLLSSIITFSQLSNKHWIPPLHSRDDSQIEDQYAYLSTAETTAFSVTVTDGLGIPYLGSPFSLSAATPVVISIGFGQPTKMFLDLNDVNTVVSDKGIILEGTKDFYVSFRMRAQNHAETIISKGRPGIGTSFRLGGMINESVDNRKNFVASVMATEDNTSVTLSDYNTSVIFTSGSGNITSDSQNFTLNTGQSIVFTGNSDVNANLDGIIGALITSTKPIAVNTGNALGGIEQNRADLTLDQIVSASQIGTEYVFIEGNGLSTMENPLIVANEDGTTITINDNTSPIITINAGEYYLVPNSYYQGTTNNKNIYVKTSKPVFAYQLLGGGASTASSGLNFIPPLSCFFQNSVNIPSVNEIGSTNPPYICDLMILTYTTSTLIVNGDTIPLSQAQAVLGSSDWVSYKILNVTGNANVVSTGPLAVGVFGFIGTASGFAGYYSGFGSTPKDTDVTVCSNTTKDLFDTINGNPGTGGTWTVPSGGATLNGNIFDPNVNIPGEYIYSFTKDCNASQTNISVKVNVTIQQTKIAGVSNSTSSCVTTAPYDLFPILGTTADIGGTWSPALPSGTGIFNPAVDVSNVYSYSFPATGSCAAVSASITVNNAVVPILNPITDFVKCDDNLDGNDTNGSVTFNLTTKTNEVLGNQPGVNVTYHINQNDADLGQSAITTINSGNTIIWVRLTIIASGCHLVTSFNLVVNPLPTVNDTTIVQCDDDLNAITAFNLTVNNPLISTNAANETFTYYTSFAGANANPTFDLIPNELAFINTTPTLMDVWTRVTNSNGCYRTAKITLRVSAPNISTNIPLPKVCDDFLDINGNNTINNNNRDGIASFDLSSTEATIRGFLPPTGTYTVKYYRNRANALAELNVITNLVNYRNNGYPTTQNIWVRIDSNISNACYGLGPFVTVNVEALPIAHPVTILRQCDDNQDGIFNFNTTSLENDLLQGQTTGVTVTYFDAVNNPLRDSNNNLITSRFPTSFSTTSQTIKAVVKNNSTLACFDETLIQFIVDKSPVNFTIPTTLTSMCDDEIDPVLQNGIYNFTNSQAIHNIVTLGQPAGMDYKYYDENNVLLSTPLPDPLLVSLSKNIKITIKNPINTTCSLTKTIQLIVNPTPKIDLEHSELVCSNLSTFFVVLTAGIVDGTSESNYMYKWYKDAVIISTETSSTLNVNTEGIYTVEVINTNGCSKTRTITVTASDVAHIGIATIVDLSFFNSVTINVTNPGLYAYSMDYPNLFQESNLFESVPAGIHEIFVKDLNGCGISQQTISVIGIPPYFTPNGDGVNDTWNVQGVSKDFNFNTTIYIFNRFGKLVKQLATTGNGWDGTLNGEPMPADDYWYAVYLEDGRISKGHFTLKR